MSRYRGCLYAAVLAAASALAQTHTSFAQSQTVRSALTPADASAIQALVTEYARALAACRAEDYADLFVPGAGYFASGIRGEIVGREKLIALVESERHCTAPADGEPTARPGGDGPKVALEVTAAGVTGVADLGRFGEYQDVYDKTAAGWRFASRTVVIPAEKAAGLDAGGMHAIQRIAGGAELGAYYAPDENGVERLRTSGVAISIVDGKVTGRAYLKDGGYYDDVYEPLGSGQWRIASRAHVPPAAH